MTIHAFPGSCPFVSNRCVERVLSRLRHTAARQHFAILAFCFMRDHLHLVVEGTDAEADLVAFIALFKQYSGFEHRQATGGRLWQGGFYDRALRKDEDTRDAVAYVLGNPVRAGLAGTAAEWPFSGSDVFDVRQFE